MLRFDHRQYLLKQCFVIQKKCLKNDAKYYYLHRDFFQRHIRLFRWLIS